MANLVTVDGQRYLVDVGFGSSDPSRPIPLISGTVVRGVSPQELKLEYEKLPQHTDPNQRMWIYRHKKNEDEPWVDGYCFTEVENFPADFAIFNLTTMTARGGLFVESIVSQRYIFNEERKELEGQLSLFRDYVKRTIGVEEEIIDTFKTEDDRVKMLEKWFKVILTAEEKEAIKGHWSEIKDEA
jgi:arylamine N-acetyltransferase